MLLIHLIVIIFILLAFCCIVQYFSELYIYTKLHNHGAEDEIAKVIAKNMSILLTFIYGILIFILICIGIQTFSGGVIV